MFISDEVVDTNGSIKKVIKDEKEETTTTQEIVGKKYIKATITLVNIEKTEEVIKTSAFDFPKGDKYFEGSVSENSFKIFRCIHYRNSFLPLIIGSIEAHEYGSTINIRMRMAIPVIVFISIWFTGVLAGCLIVPFTGFPMPAALIPYIMLVFGILLVIIPNKIEAKKAREKLEELLI